MIEENNDRKLRLLQAKTLKETNDSCSYSTTINDVLRKALK